MSFEIQIDMGNTGGQGYGTAGAHINIDSGTIVSCLETETGFPNCVTGTDPKEYSEFYHTGDWSPSTTIFGYLTLQAPSSGTINIQYRAWMRDDYTCSGSGQGRLYRDPVDYGVGQGTCTEKSNFMDYTTYTTTVAVATPLTDDTSMSVDLSYGPRRFSFNVPSTRWAIAGIRLTDGDDHDLRVDDDPSFGSYKSSTKSGITPDFVVVNGHNNWGDYYAEVGFFRYGSGHSAMIEAEGGSTDRIDVGSDWYFSMGSNEVNEMYEVYLDSSKTFTITLDVTSGSADLDLFIYNPSTTVENRYGADMSSKSGGAGEDEVITGFSPSSTGYAGIAVIHDGTGSDSASYTLTVTENNPPTASGKSFTPPSGDTNTNFDFYMTYTDIDNDPHSAGYPMIQFDEYGNQYSMSKTYPTDNDYTDGVIYDYSRTKLSAGSHTYRYKYKNDYSSTLYYPTSGTFTGPTVSSAPDTCGGVVPGLVGGYPKVEDNFAELSLIEFLQGINAWAGIINEKFIDANILVRTTESQCVFTVESILWNVGNESYLDPFPLNYDSSDDTFKGNYIHQETIDWDEVKEKSREETQDAILKLLEKFAKKKGWKTTQAVLKKLAWVLSVIPNVPPELVIEQVNIIDKSSISHPYLLDEKVDIPTYLPEEVEDVVFWIRGMIGVIVHSPVDILIVGPDGNRVGALYQNGSFIGEVNELGNLSFYSGVGAETEFILIMNPKFGNYTLEVMGTDYGIYDLEASTVVNESINDLTFLNVTTSKKEKHIYLIEYGIKQADIHSIIYNTRDFNPGDVVTVRFYIENLGTVELDDEILFSIKDPAGKVIYNKKKFIYVESGEMQSIKFDWIIPVDAVKGEYRLKAEFEDKDIDGLPETKYFNVE